MKWIGRMLIIMQITALGWVGSLLYSQLAGKPTQKFEESQNISPANDILVLPTFVSWELKPIADDSQQKVIDVRNSNEKLIIEPQRTTSEVLCSPMKGVEIDELTRYISDGYHPPPPGSDGRHMGVDFAFYRGQKGKEISEFEVNAILPGIAAAVVFDKPPYGNMVIIETRFEDIAPELAERINISIEQSLYHLYAHLRDAPAVDVGHEVYCGQFLGRVGSSGASSNPHLHLETRYGKPGKRFDSLGYDRTASLKIAITNEEKENYFLWRTSGEFQHFNPMKLLLIQEDN